MDDPITRGEAARLTGYTTRHLSMLHRQGRGPTRLPNKTRTVYYSRAEVLRWKQSPEYRRGQ